MGLAECIRRRLLVSGLVQGVGFRPFVCDLAGSLGLTGFVGNDASGVVIEVQGSVATVAAFARDLVNLAPPPALVEATRVQELVPREEICFGIAASRTLSSGSAIVAPDISTCNDCLRDLFIPEDRRFRYPFVTCSRCGPRFTLLRDLPFDRANTSMVGFRMCPACESEYLHAGDRRHHAQTTACPACGPHLWFTGAVDEQEPADAIERTRDALATGLIVAIKGVGGFHLTCDATNEVAISRLRQLKGRGDKPFALMAATPAVVREYAELGPDEERLMTGRERPVVLLRRRKVTESVPLSPYVAPRTAWLGFMLPYTPLHHLLLKDRPLVMTSGNVSGEPIITSNDVAVAQLATIADAFLLHDRDILTPCDDSVARVFEGVTYPVRRSRGYAPLPVGFAIPGPVVLAVGGESKAAFCLANANRAYLSQHFGEMGNPKTLAAFSGSVEHLCRLLSIEPRVVACDAHPEYHSSHWAESYARDRGLPLFPVQHHRAHVASLLTEHERCEPVIGVCFDGTGYGDDGAIWGGEVFVGDAGSMRRVAHLDYVPLAGGDVSIERPYRMALAYLQAAGIAWHESLACVRACRPVERGILLTQLARNLNCVPTSSAGRLFDAVAALVGIRQVVTYEAQAAIELEEAVEYDSQGCYDFAVIRADPLRIDPRPVFRSIVRDLGDGVPVSIVAGRFHHGLAEAVACVCRVVRDRIGLNTVGLTGGVFQNITLLGFVADALRRDRFEVLLHRKVPPNDGGLSLGQAAIARASLIATAPRSG